MMCLSLSVIIFPSSEAFVFDLAKVFTDRQMCRRAEGHGLINSIRRSGHVGIHFEECNIHTRINQNIRPAALATNLVTVTYKY